MHGKLERARAAERLRGEPEAGRGRAYGDLGNRIGRFCGAVGAGAGTGNVEIGMIEDVVGVRLDMETEALVDARVLLEGEIEARLERAAEGIRPLLEKPAS